MPKKAAKTKRTAFITGAGRGIGKAIALALASRDFRVVLAARNEKEIQAVAKEVQKKGGEALAIAMDVTDEVSVERALMSARKKFGTVDVLVNNAGTAKSAPLLKTDLALWNELLTLNLTGTFLCTRAVLGGMLENGWGRVINVASTAGKIGGAYISAYSASKHGVVGFTRSVALEVAGKGVTVNAVCPGYVNTPLTQKNIQRIVDRTGRSESETRAHLEGINPLNRFIEPEEVAALVLFLCSEEASGMNGQAINLDGGSVTS